jgi:hypothetical protein
MTEKKGKVQVVGSRVLIQKERIDAGGLRLTPTQELEGQKNYGKVLGVGQIGLRLRLAGLRKGKTIIFRKFFVANDGLEDARTFVNCEDIIAILN